MSDVVTPLKRVLKRESADGASTKKKSAKKMKLGTPNTKRVEESTTTTPLEQKKKGKRTPNQKKEVNSTPSPSEKKKMKVKQEAKEVGSESKSPKTTSEKSVKKSRGKPDGSDKENLKAKTGPMKILKGTTKKVKSFDKTKLKPGLKKKVDGADGDGTESADVKKTKLELMKKKERKEFRKMHTLKKPLLKNNYDLIKKTKRMWEELRRHDIDDVKRAKICLTLANLIRGRAKEMIFAHDTCRVVQCLMQYGNEKHRDMLFEELKDSIVEMTKSKYAKFFIRKIMKYGNKQQKNLVFTSFHGKVRKLVRHGEAAQILEYCYNDYANAVQRSTVVEEFYGPTFALFKNDGVRSLEQIMTSEPQKKESILSNMKEALLPLVDKNFLLYSLVHRIFYEYFAYCTPKSRTEMIELLRELLVPMLHTRDGSRVAMYCIWYGTSKDRKCIIKSLKGHVVKLCKEEHGHLVLLAMFDSVDDTKLVQKVILDELFKSVHEVATDAQGKKVLQYLLCRRDPRHFHPDIIKILQQGDANTNSKKDTAVRARELLEFASPKLYQYVVNKTRDLVSENASVLLMLDILTHGAGDSTEALKAVAEIVVEPYPGDDEESHILATAAGHICLRKLIGMDKDKAANERKDLFSLILLEELDPGMMKSWITCNRGCFTIISLFETDIEQVKSRIGKELSKTKKTLAGSDTKGAQVLLKKLETL